MGNGLEARKNMCIRKIMRYHMAVNKSKGRNIEAGVLQATPNFCEARTGKPDHHRWRGSCLSQSLNLQQELRPPASTSYKSIATCQTSASMYCHLSIAIISGVKRSYHGLHQFLSLPVHFFLCCSRPTENRTGPNLMPIRELVNFSETLKEYSKKHISFSPRLKPGGINGTTGQAK